MTSSGDPVHGAITAAFRDEWGRLTATLIGWCGDWDLAEEATQDAFLQAQRRWPGDGIPDRPAAWLLTTARRRVIDRVRRRQSAEAAAGRLAVLAGPGSDEPVDDPVIGDDRLRLIFTCCHPALGFNAQVALALRTLTGLTTAEIAAAFGVAEPTMAKRLVRAKRKITDAAIPYRVPPPHLLPQRTSAVLGVVYLLYNEGHLATTGGQLQRPDLAAEALRLAELLAALLPDDPEVSGLLALLQLQRARAATRTGPDGALVPLPDQDRSRWNSPLIAAALARLQRAAEVGPIGPYQLQAMIAACHLTTPTAQDTDWSRIVALYDALQEMVPSPTVALNRVVAVGMLHGPAAGLRELGRAERSVGLPPGHLAHAVRADLLRRAGNTVAAADAYRAAMDAGTGTTAERRHLARRLAALDADSSDSQPPGQRGIMMA